MLHTLTALWNQWFRTWRAGRSQRLQRRQQRRAHMLRVMMEDNAIADRWDDDDYPWSAGRPN